MSNRELKKIKKELININNKFYRHKFILKALNGLYLVDLSKSDDRKITPVGVIPKNMNVEIIDANIEDIIICGMSGNDTVFIINDVL